MSETLNTASLTPAAGLPAITAASILPGSTLVGGKPWTPPTVSLADGGGITVAILCVRSGSPEIAQFFIDQCGGGEGMFTTAYDGSTPPEAPGSLNFCFGCQIAFGATTLDLYFGQGHDEDGLKSVNNWWLGGTAISAGEGACYRQITIGGQAYGLAPGKGSVDTICLMPLG
jgi:hypothetical protein